MTDTDTDESARPDVYPPGNWHPRDAPTVPEIDAALAKARRWRWHASFGNADDCLTSFLDLFERYLSGEVRRRSSSGGIQSTLEAHGDGSTSSDRPAQQRH